MSTLKEQNYNILDSYFSPDKGKIDLKLVNTYKNFNKKIVVLDDDPTGVQTVNDISVYTDWSEDSLKKGFSEDNIMFYILTNSRSFSATKTREVHQEIAKNLCKISAELNKDFILISRGDSTLRGHYPLETEILKQKIEELSDKKYNGEIICPFFQEGGRYTIANIHYVKEGKRLIPTGQTEFAKDRTFAYTESHLGKYVEEKTSGMFKSEDCTYITLDEIRNMEIDSIVTKLLRVKNFNKVIVNAIKYLDIKVFCIAFIKAVNEGKSFLFRTAASMPKILANVSDKPLLLKNDLIDVSNNHGGLVVIGSHVKKTTRQLEELKKSRKNLKFIEFQVDLVFKEGALEKELKRVIDRVEEGIVKGTSMVVYTSRTPIKMDVDEKDRTLEISVKISEAVTKVVEELNVRPRFIIAKGGITSSDIGTKALKVKQARVMGQIKPGIPVWMTGDESKFSRMPYIIFPGNVGEVDTLREIVDELS